MKNQVNIGDQNAQQIGQNPVSRSAQTPEKSKVNYWMISTLILVSVVMFLLILIVFGLNKNFKSESHQNIIGEENATPTGAYQLIEGLDLEASDFWLAFRLGGKFHGKGDLAITNTDNTKRYKITSVQNIEFVHGWSPDNKYIAVTSSKLTESETAVNYKTVAVDTNSGQITKLKELQRQIQVGGPGEPGNVFWYSKDILGYHDYYKEDIVEKISAKDGILQNTLVISDSYATTAIEFNGGEISPLLSQNKKWLGFDSGGPDGSAKSINIFSYNLEIKQRKQLTKMGPAYFIGWKQNKIVYFTSTKGIESDGVKTTIWEVTPDGSETKIIGILKDVLVFPQLSENGDRLFYLTKPQEPRQDKKLVVYEFSTGTTKTVSLAPMVRSSEWGAINMASSSNGKFVSLELVGVGFNSIYTVEVKTEKIVKICSSCYYPKWSH